MNRPQLRAQLCRILENCRIAFFFAQGCSGQGVALAVLGGKLLAEAAIGNSERFSVFARLPAKAFPGGALLRKPLFGFAMNAMEKVDTL